MAIQNTNEVKQNLTGLAAHCLKNRIDNSSVLTSALATSILYFNCFAMYHSIFFCIKHICFTTLLSYSGNKLCYTSILYT